MARLMIPGPHRRRTRSVGIAANPSRGVSQKWMRWSRPRLGAACGVLGFAITTCR